MSQEHHPDSMGRRRGPDAETSAKLANESRRGFMFKLGSVYWKFGFFWTGCTWDTVTSP